MSASACPRLPPVFLTPLSPSASVSVSSTTPKSSSTVAATAAQLRQAPPNFFPFSSNPFVVRYQTAMSVPDAVPESLALAPDAGVFRRSMP